MTRRNRDRRDFDRDDDGHIVMLRHKWWCRDPDRRDEKPDDDKTQTVSRTLDGADTNADHPDWGAADQQLLRFAPARYEDALGEMDAALPNARVVSNAIAAQDGDVPSSVGASDMLWAWGQFIDHDLDLTDASGSEATNISAPAGDPVFADGGEIAFTRIAHADGTGETSPREYENQITAFLDASMVYGSDAETAASLRDGAYLMLGADDLLVLTDSGVLAGDVRGAENIALTSLHTVFAREHNAWVDRLAAQDPGLSDEALFDGARMRVEAIVQAITFNEFLPMLLGEGTIAAYDGYDASANPGISVEFSTAAYRFGHSLLSPELLRLNEDGSSIAAGAISLQEAFLNPGAITANGGVDPIIRGLAGSTAQELDNQVVEDVRSFLFAPTGEIGLDLAATNIQRGRDLGVGSYNDLREALGFERAETFADITTDADIAAQLQVLYGDVDRVDAWVGGLAEDPAGDGMLGQTFAAIILDQFTRIRDGDALWSEAGQFSDADRDALWGTTLADVLERNTGIDALQDDIFHAYTRLAGDGADNALAGTSGSDLVLGLDGDDALDGGDGDDQLEGGSGDDTLIGGAGNDVLYGGEGADSYVFNTASGMDVIADFETADRLVLDIDGRCRLRDLVQRDGDDLILTLSADAQITLLDTSMYDLRGSIELI